MPAVIDSLTCVRPNAWLRRRHPFPHFVAMSVFSAGFYSELERAFHDRFARGLADRPDGSRFSRNMPYSDAYSWNLPADLDGPLAFFYSQEWHGMLAALTETTPSGEVNAALHHHHLNSKNGSIHRDLSIGWFPAPRRNDGVNRMDLSRCGYTTGELRGDCEQAVERVRYVTMIYYLANPPWRPGDGGETALYAYGDDPLERPAVQAAPRNNSILVFENTRFSWHSFLTNTRNPRNSLILWLHSKKEDAARRVGDATSRF